MKTTFLKNCAIVFSLCCLFFYGILYACGGDWDWDYNENSSFTPETFVDKSYSPLFFSNYLYFYGIGSDTEHATRFNDEVLTDWTTFLKTNLSPKLVRYFLLESSSKVVKELRTYYANNKKTTLVSQWEKKIKLKDPKVKSFIQFLYYAQILENASNSDSYDWTYENKLVFEDVPWLKTIENKYETATDAFMKNRYWFQTMKGYYYNQNLEKATAFFEKTKEATPKNTLYYRALAYIAGLEYQSKHYAKSNYLFSQVFDQCPPLRVVAATCFHPQEQTDWEQALRLAKTNDEKAALWAIQGYYGDEKLATEKIYGLSPKSEHLHYLLTRLINIQEHKFAFDFDKKSIPEIKSDIKAAIDIPTYDWIVKIAQEGKTSKPYLWHLAAGYLQTLKGDFEVAKTSYAKAEQKMPTNPLAKSQLRLLRFMNQWFALDTIKNTDETALLPDMQWLYVDCVKQAPQDFRFRAAIDISKKYLSVLYKNQNNAVMSELFNSKSGFYGNVEQLNAMKSFLSKPTNYKTPYEQLATKIYDISLSDINDFQAVEATFQNKIPDAIMFMEQSSDSDEQLYGNPFIGRIQDCHDCDHAEYQKTKYSRLQLLQFINGMQHNLVANKDVFNSALLLGNAFYNITYFGNARHFYEGKINGYGMDTYSRGDCSIARLYYQKALAAAKTDEQKAKCHYMLAKCERNEYYSKKYENDTYQWTWGNDEDKINFLAWNGFKELKNNYANTKFYQEVLQECGYFNTYVSQSK
jgi:hypothetical protein